MCLSCAFFSKKHYILVYFAIRKKLMKKQKNLITIGFPPCYAVPCFGTPKGILPVLPHLSPRFACCHVGKNSPPDCFLPLTLPPCSNPVFTNTKQKETPEGVSFYLARRKGFEPPTLCLEGRCSIRLSYRRISQGKP